MVLTFSFSNGPTGEHCDVLSQRKGDGLRMLDISTAVANVGYVRNAISAPALFLDL